MSTSKRAYDLLRGYVNREWDRIHGVDPFAGAYQAVDEASAVGEIEEAMSHPAPRPAAEVESYDIKSRARAILGVDVDAPYDTIRRAFERLNKRADPKNFPVGSAEAHQAGQIQRRVYEAYQILIREMDSSEIRFRSLEID